MDYVYEMDMRICALVYLGRVYVYAVESEEGEIVESGTKRAQSCKWVEWGIFFFLFVSFV